MGATEANPIDKSLQMMMMIRLVTSEQSTVRQIVASHTIGVDKRLVDHKWMLLRRN